MQAAWFEKFGMATDVLRVGEREQPRPAAGEVLIKMSTSGINPSDVKKRAGSFPNLLDEGFVIPNSDGAGVIEEVGDGVDPGRIGQRVWVYQAQFARRFGTAAEYVAIDSSRAPPLPERTSFEAGACLGIPVMTAHRTVFAGDSPEGMYILVTGGAGRVGHYAIQWAVQAGAKVVATASNTDDEQACRTAGADHVVNHRDSDWSQHASEAIDGEMFDRVIDVEFGANLESVLPIIRVGGSIHTYSSTQVSHPELPFFDMMYKDLTIRTIIVYAMPEVAKQRAIADIDQALRGGALDHRIAATLPLTDIVRGNEIVESSNCRGAVVLDLN